MKILIKNLFLISFILSTIILIIILIGSKIFDIQITELTRDLAFTAKVHPFTGLLSNLGSFIWCASGSICLLGAIIVYSGQIDPSFRLIDPLAEGNIPEGQPKNGFTMNA